MVKQHEAEHQVYKGQIYSCNYSPQLWSSYTLHLPSCVRSDPHNSL